MFVDSLLERSAQRFPDKTAVVCGETRVSYRDVDERANRLAHALVDGGLRRGDRVGICVENSADAVVSLFAVLKAGGAFFIVDPQAGRERLVHLLADCEASALIARPAPINWVHGARPPSVKIVFEAGATTDSARGVAAPPVPGRSDTDLAALVYTSGSTGGPKGVMLTHHSLSWAASTISAYLGNTADDVILSALPLAFTYGLGQVTTACCAGATLVLERSFAYPAAIVDTMLRERVTGFPLVPTIATLLLRHLNERRRPRLRYLTNAAAALSPDRIDQLRQALPGTTLFSMYGLTECQRVSYLPPDQLDSRPTSVGMAIPGTEAFIVDDDGRRVPAGVCGELVVRGPHLMKGYWKRPDATATALRTGADGGPLLYTGDLFTMDRDGFLYFVARKDDIIKTRGEKVAPREIEEIIGRLPGVAEVSVYGVPDDLLGEAIAAAVTPAPGAIVTPDLVRRHCLRHLQPFMVPAAVDIRDSLPTTATGKIDRRTLRSNAAAGEASA